MRHHLESHFSAKCALLNRLIERGLQELVDSLQDALTLPASLNISLIGLSSHILPQFIHILGGTLIPTAISITPLGLDDAAAILTLLASDNDDDDDLVDTLDLFLLPSDSLWFRCKRHAPQRILSSVL